MFKKFYRIGHAVNLQKSTAGPKETGFELGSLGPQVGVLPIDPPLLVL